MLAPLATLAFLTVLWLVGVVIAGTLDRTIGKIAAALRSRSTQATASGIRIAVRVRLRARPQPALRAQPQLRAAA